MSTSAVTTCIITAAVCSLLLVAQGQMDDEEWIDPYDILNYDASTKTMRKPAEVSQLPSCNAVFKQFLTKLLKEIEKFGLPSDFQNDLYYDTKVRLSRQALAEIWTLLEGMDSCRMGALDDALSQILVDLKPQEFEASRWHFEDTFGVEIDTVMKEITMTITNFFTETQKHFGQRISEFLVALKDLPVTLQIPVLFIIVLSILVFMYCSCQAAIRPGIMRLLRIGRPRDPPPPAVDQPEPKAHLRGTNHDPQAGGDAPQCSPPRYVETLRNDDRLFSNVQEEIQQEPVVAGATTEGNDSQEAKPSPAKAKPNERDVTSESKVATDWEAEQLAKRQPSTTTQGNNTLEKSSEEKMVHGETDRVPVQETEPTSLAL